MNEIEQAINHFERLQKRYTTQHNGKHCNLVATALTALREKQERESGCEFCNHNRSVLFYAGIEESDYLTLTNIGYCPKCGRRLEVRQE